MLLTDYLDSIQGTEQEARFFEVFAVVKDAVKQLTRIPVVGKLFEALVVLDDLGSIETFVQCEHYQNIRGWDIFVNLDKGVFSIYPGAESRKKIFTFLALFGIGVLLLCLWRRGRHR